MNQIQNEKLKEVLIEQWKTWNYYVCANFETEYKSKITYDQDYKLKLYEEFLTNAAHWGLINLILGFDVNKIYLEDLQNITVENENINLEQVAVDLKTVVKKWGEEDSFNAYYVFLKICGFYDNPLHEELRKKHPKILGKDKLLLVDEDKFIEEKNTVVVVFDRIYKILLKFFDEPMNYETFKETFKRINEIKSKKIELSILKNFYKVLHKTLVLEKENKGDEEEWHY